MPNTSIFNVAQILKLYYMQLFIRVLKELYHINRKIISSIRRFYYTTKTKFSAKSTGGG